MTHKKEIEYWAKQPDGTGVWVYNKTEAKWLLQKIPSFSPSHIWVVDNEWAELRKANAEGKIIQFKNDNKDWISVQDDWWNNWFYSDSRTYSPEDFRVKPKEWYERIPPEGIICWIGEKKAFVKIIKKYHPDKTFPFEDEEGKVWFYATPVKPEECWQEE